MPDDIRDRPTIDHADVVELNFVRSSAPYVFRRHHRQGLRSHIMEILRVSDVANERTGKVDGAVRRFPKARPRRMFRIFRTRLGTIANALAEIERVKIVDRYLAPDFMARSTECLVDYQGPNGRDLVLCGFQEYVSGEIVDPWTILDAAEVLPAMYQTLRQREDAVSLPRDRWMGTVRRKCVWFVARIKRMITEAGHIPDLAGSGNLILTGTGQIRLVDINNISPVVFDPVIRLDEKGYPVGDKSIEALALIEAKIIGRPIDLGEPAYRHFLDPERRQRVREKEISFRKTNSEK